MVSCKPMRATTSRRLRKENCGPPPLSTGWKASESSRRRSATGLTTRCCTTFGRSRCGSRGGRLDEPLGEDHRLVAVNENLVRDVPPQGLCKHGLLEIL